jgi:hypothetical protein
MHRPARFLPLAALALAACFRAPYALYTASTPATYPPKTADCPFAIVTTLPDAPLEQLGILDVRYAGCVNNAAAFKSVVSQHTCYAGGEIVLAEGERLRLLFPRERLPAPRQPERAAARRRHALIAAHVVDHVAKS